VAEHANDCGGGRLPVTYQQHMDAASREYVLRMLNQHDWCVTRAARAAGCNRTHFYKIMRGAGIEPTRTQRGNEAWRAMQ
jgi:transcriptional regulator of acetoin/glycerol metabolism